MIVMMKKTKKLEKMLRPVTVVFGDGRAIGYSALATAIHHLVARGWVVGHSGDLLDGGERTLVWEDLESAEDDDGRRAIAEIRWAA